MSSDFSPELRRELLDEFYSECDELLTAVREGLTQLESDGGKKLNDARVIEGLFRNMHSLKGISAIVGLRPAEELAHAMEDVLRVLSKSGARATDEMIEGLLAGAQRLEKIISAHRFTKAFPETADLLAQFKTWLPAVAPEKSPASTSEVAESENPAVDPIEAARACGLQLYRATFTPSPERDRNGSNVTSVRERLGGIGEIVSAAPVVRGRGSIVFEFVVGFKEVPDDLAGWAADGIEFVPFPPAPVVVAPEADVGFSNTLSLAPSHIVRVELARLDDLMRIAGEMVILRSRLEERLQRDSGEASGFAEINRALGRSLREMRTAISRVRMVPIAEIFSRMPFVVRDLLRDTDKKARVALEGNLTEVDKYLVERLKEPLLHLVRNAIAHGIERPEVRVSKGKPAEATIVLRAQSAGELVVIQVRDDGRGIDANVIRARATALGLAVPTELDQSAILRLLCAPGFSTRDHADRAAGRGVGMDVVANVVRELGGTLALESEMGVGTQFTLRLPLTLSIAHAIIVNVGSESCAVPQSGVDEIVQVEAGSVRTIQTAEMIPYRGGLLPFVRLRKMFGVAPMDTAMLTLLVVRSERGATGLVVDSVRSQREIVIRPLSDPLLRVPGISGATELGDGRPILILDPAAITQGVVRPPTFTESPASTFNAALGS